MVRPTAKTAAVDGFATGGEPGFGVREGDPRGYAVLWNVAATTEAAPARNPPREPAEAVHRTVRAGNRLPRMVAVGTPRDPHAASRGLRVAAASRCIRRTRSQTIHTRARAATIHAQTTGIPTRDSQHRARCCVQKCRPAAPYLFLTVNTLDKPGT